MNKIESIMPDCERCKELISILKEVKKLMDSEQYMEDYDSIYDKIVTALE